MLKAYIRITYRVPFDEKERTASLESAQNGVVMLVIDEGKPIYLNLKELQSALLCIEDAEV